MFLTMDKCRSQNSPTTTMNFFERRVSKLAIKRISAYDEKVLLILYENRAMTIEQLSKELNKTMNSVYCKVSRLQRSGYIETEGASRIKNHENTNAQGKYAFVTDKGITLLQGLGHSFKRSSKRNKPTKNQLPFVLLANEIAFEINKEQWSFMNGRDAKVYFNRRSNELLNGMVKSKLSGEEYCLYVMLSLGKSEKSPSEKYTGMLSTEMSNHYEVMKSGFNNGHLTERIIQQYIFFCRGVEWYDHLIKELPKVDKGKFLLKVKSLRVLPFKVGKMMLRSLASEEIQNEFCKSIIELSDSSTSFETSFEITINEMKFGIDFKIAFEDGEICYGVNMVDMDLKKMFRLKYYTEFEYERYGKKRIIVYGTSLNVDILRLEVESKYIEVREVEMLQVMQLLEGYE